MAAHSYRCWEPRGGICPVDCDCSCHAAVALCPNCGAAGGHGARCPFASDVEVAELGPESHEFHGGAAGSFASEGCAECQALEALDAEPGVGFEGRLVELPPAEAAVLEAEPWRGPVGWSRAELVVDQVMARLLGGDSSSRPAPADVLGELELGGLVVTEPRDVAGEAEALAVVAELVHSIARRRAVGLPGLEPDLGNGSMLVALRRLAGALDEIDSVLRRRDNGLLG